MSAGDPQLSDALGPDRYEPLLQPRRHHRNPKKRPIGTIHPGKMKWCKEPNGPKAMLIATARPTTMRPTTVRTGTNSGQSR